MKAVTKWIPETLFVQDVKILIKLQPIIKKKTKFQELLIAHSENFGKMLFLDGDHQSSEKDEFIYHESLVQPAMLFHDCPKKILILGTGEGATLREVLKHSSVEQIVAVDIDEEAVNIYKEYLTEMHQGSFCNPKVKLIYDNAMNYIQKTKKKFDVIIADLTDPLTDIANDFYDKKCFLRLEKILEKDGLFATHLGSSDFYEGKNFKKILMDLKDVFKTICFYHSYIPSFFTTWGFALASSGIDLNKLEYKKIDERITERNIKNKALNSEAFQGMTCLPNYLREYLLI